MEGFVSNESSAFTLSDERDFEIEEKMRKSTPDTPGLFKKMSYFNNFMVMES